jgi:hypothetical protein
VCRLSPCVNLDKGRQRCWPELVEKGCSTWAATAEPPSDSDDDDGGANYDVFYQRLGMH